MKIWLARTRKIGVLLDNYRPIMLQVAVEVFDFLRKSPIILVLIPSRTPRPKFKYQHNDSECFSFSESFEVQGAFILSELLKLS